MKKLLLAGIAALLVSTGAAHATSVCQRQCLGIGVGLKEVMSKTGTSKSLLVYLPRGVTVATV